MRDMELRFVGQSLSGAAIENRGEGKEAISGYGAVYYREGDAATEYRLFDDLVERIMPGAFDRAIREDDVRGLFNHSPDHLLGRTASGTMRLVVDKTGLRYEIDPPDTGVGRDVMESIRRGDLSGSSFSFTVEDQSWRDVKDGDRMTTIREIRSVRLFDVGPVTFPAYEGTTTELAKRSLLDWRKSQGVPMSLNRARVRMAEVDSLSIY